MGHRQRSSRTCGLRRVMLVAILLALLAAVAAPAAAWLLSNALTDIRYVSDSYPLRIIAVQPGGPGQAAGRSGATGTVTLTNGPDAAEPGKFRLAWPGGAGLVGSILGESLDGVTRAFTPITGNPRAGVRAGIEPARYTGTPANLGLPFSTVNVPSTVGPLPTWFVPAAGLTVPKPSWVLLVHGLGGSRTDTLPVMGIWHQLGFPILAVTYRNDAGAPASLDRRSHLGLTESHDLDAAVGYALDHGASKVIIEGFSLGGTLALLAADNGLHRSAIAGLVLDSPMLSWHDTLAFATGSSWTADFTCMGLSWRVGDVCGQITEGRLAAAIRLPTLLIQGGADRVVPTAAAVRVRSLRPALVTLRLVQGADHVSAIDTDTASYTNSLSQFACGFQKSATYAEQRPYATRSYSLISPPRTGRRVMRLWLRFAAGWVGRGG